MTVLVFELCERGADVLSDAISESEFAANLSFVVSGKAQPDHQEAARFFANTYPTDGLSELLANVCRPAPGAWRSITARPIYTDCAQYLFTVASERLKCCAAPLMLDPVSSAMLRQPTHHGPLVAPGLSCRDG
jgi:hypothetical protein